MQKERFHPYHWKPQGRRFYDDYEEDCIEFDERIEELREQIEALKADVAKLKEEH